MTDLDSLLFALSLGVLPIAALLAAHYALWDLDRALKRTTSERGPKKLR